MSDESLNKLKEILDVITLRTVYYCPRCNTLKKWYNACGDGIHKSMKCSECGLEEGELMTEEEQIRMETYVRNNT